MTNYTSRLLNVYTNITNINANNVDFVNTGQPERQITEIRVTKPEIESLDIPSLTRFNFPGSLGGLGVVRVHVQVPGVRARGAPPSGLSPPRRHFRAGLRPRSRKAFQGLPRQIRNAA